MDKRGKIRKESNVINKLKLPHRDIIFIPALFWKRILAFVIDLLVIDLIIISPFRSIFEKLLSSELSFTTARAYFELNPELLNKLTGIIVIISILVISYFSVLQFKIRQTLGMMIFNLWIYTEDKQLSLWKCLISNISFIPIFPFIILWIIDPIFLGFSVSKQRLMQKLTGIYIVEEAIVGFSK